MEYKEIEVRFLEIDAARLIERLKELDAEDKGEDLFRETIFHDQKGEFIPEHKFIRIREGKDGALLAYKQHKAKGQDLTGIDDVDEVEMKIDEPKTMRVFLEKIGFEAFRIQEKKRHAFVLDDVGVDIDTWPKIPTYVELEGESEDALRAAAEKLGLDWGTVYFNSAREVIERVYGLPLTKYRYFTFDKVE